MNSVNTAAIAASSAAVAGIAARRSAEDEARRKSHEGNDQILIRTKKGSYEKVVEIISELYGCAPMTKNGALKIPNPEFNFDAIIVFIIFGFIALMADALNITNFSFAENSATVVIISILYGYFARDDSFNSIEIEDDDEEVLTQINVYNSSGYRNYSEIQISKIMKEFKKANLMQKEE